VSVEIASALREDFWKHDIKKAFVSEFSDKTRTICANFYATNKPPLSAKNTVNHTYNVRTPEAFDSISDTVSWSKYLKECVAFLSNSSYKLARFLIHTLEKKIIALFSEKYGKSKKFLGFLVDKLVVFTRDEKNLSQVVTVQIYDIGKVTPNNKKEVMVKLDGQKFSTNRMSKKNMCEHPIFCGPQSIL